MQAASDQLGFIATSGRPRGRDLHRCRYCKCEMTASPCLGVLKAAPLTVKGIRKFLRLRIVAAVVTARTVPPNRDDAGKAFAGTSNREAQLVEAAGKAAREPRRVRLDRAGTDAAEQRKRDLNPGGGCEIVVAEVEAAGIGHQPEIITPAGGLVGGAELDAETCK